MTTTTPFILVVEDEPASRMALCQTLQQAGYRVWLATNGREALTLLAFMPVNLVLSDLDMPMMDGRQLHTAIRARPEWAGVPFVLMLSDSDCGKVGTLEVSGIVAKPYQTEELLATLQAVLDP